MMDTDRCLAGGKLQQCMKSESPSTELPSAEPAFAQADTSTMSIGNPKFTAELINEGKLGLFLPRHRSLHNKPIPVTINVLNYRNCIYRTLEAALNRLLQKKIRIEGHGIYDRVTSVAESLADGCCLMTYMKLRALVFLEFPDGYNSISLRKPKAYKDFPIPTPFAFAIQQLGSVDVADLPVEAEHRYVPVYPTSDHRYGIPLDRTWNSNAYAQAVAYARNLGMQFSTVDLNKKHGTAWWLLRPYYAEEIFELQCPFPEVNFTNRMALTYTLFLSSEEADPTNAIFDLVPIGTSNYGSILHDPHVGINVSTFESIEEKALETAVLV